ncbi:MAG TPA: PDZ domain-containing protein [Candidatus Binatia bacterium]
MKLRILLCFIFVIGAVSVCTVASAQSSPRAVLGVMLRELNPEETQRGLQGAFVQEVLPNGSADKAGIRPGDVIVAANRQALASAAQLVQMIGARSPGDVIELFVLRSGRRQTMSVALAPFAPSQGTPRAEQSATPPGKRESPALSTGSAPPAGGAASTGVIRFRPFSVRDPQLNNMEALRLLVPADWRVEGGILWRHDRAILATAVLRIFNPNGSEELNLLPIEQFAQANPGYGFNIGSNYLGSELQPAMDPQTFVSRIVMPRYRRQVGSATPSGGGELPAVAQAAQTPGMPSQMRAGRFRYSYNFAGKQMEEDVYCVLSYTSAPAVKSVYWSPEQLYSIRAERGQLDQKTKLMQAIVSSTRINLQWYNAYLQVWEMWKANVMQSIQNAGHLSRYIAGINNQITATKRQAWEQQQASYDRISRRFSEYTRGVETYHNPVSNQPIQLPGGYGHAWTNALGEYIVSDSSSYNPNIGSSTNWQALQRVP